MADQIELTDLEKDLIELLGARRGEGNAISREKLCEALYPVPERTIREVIKHLVTKHGIPIASGPNGYYTPITADEIRRCCDYYHRYAMASLEVEAKLRQVSLPELLGQIRMDLRAKALLAELREEGAEGTAK